MEKDRVSDRLRWRRDTLSEIESSRKRESEVETDWQSEKNTEGIDRLQRRETH